MIIDLDKFNDLPLYKCMPSKKVDITKGLIYLDWHVNYYNKSQIIIDSWISLEAFNYMHKREYDRIERQLSESKKSRVQPTYI